jgi:hypothetical protein
MRSLFALTRREQRIIIAILALFVIAALTTHYFATRSQPVPAESPSTPLPAATMSAPSPF